MVKPIIRDVMFLSRKSEEATEQDTQVITTEENEPVAVYGPPEFFTEQPTVDENDLTEVYGPPPEDF